MGIKYIIIPEELVETVNGKYAPGLYLQCEKIGDMNVIPKSVLHDTQFATIHPTLSVLETIEIEVNANDY